MQLPIQRAQPRGHRHHWSSCAAILAGVPLDAGDAAVREANDAIGHAGDRGVVGDDDGRRAELAVDAFERLEDDDAGRDVERAGRLVAEQHVRPLGDGAGDRHALLLAARELRGKVVEPMVEADHPEGLLRRHRVLDDLGDERHVLARRQARDQVVELEHEADVRAAIFGQLRVVRPTSGCDPGRRRRPRSARRGRRGC